MRSAIVMATACLAFLAGCAVGPDYHPPKSSTSAQQWTSPLVGGETNGSADLAAWWKNFDDTNLDSLVTVAIESNLTLRVAEVHVREARAERDVTSGSFWPSVGTSGSYSRNRYGQNNFPPLPPGTPLDYNLYHAGFDATWELDVFGGTRRTIEAASADLDGDTPLLAVDGWNIAVNTAFAAKSPVPVIVNTEAQVGDSSSPPLRVLMP